MATGHRQHQHHDEAAHHHGHSHAGEDLLSVEAALERIMSSFAPLEAVDIPLLECLGQTLAENVASPLALPPLANSGMDGYAVRGGRHRRGVGRCPPPSAGNRHGGRRADA